MLPSLFAFYFWCTKHFHEPFQIENRKIELKVQSKVGSLDNVKHRPGGGQKKVFNDVEYLKQMSETSGAQLMAKSATETPNSSRRESAVQVFYKVAWWKITMLR